MNLDRFWAFVNLVYKFNGGERTAIKMCKGELRLGRWNEYYSKTRKEFQQCIDEVVLENPNFNKTLFVYLTKFQELIKRYEKAEILNEVVDKEKDEKKYYLQQIHKTRYKEVKTASYHIKLYLVDYVKEIKDSLSSEEKESLKNKEEEVYNEHCDDEKLKTMYLSKANVYYMNKSDEELQEIYTEIKDEYLSRDSSFEQFKYCMSGQGNPTPRISWVGQKDTLAYFIETFFEDDGRKWKKSECVFGMKVANANLQNSKKGNPFAYLKKKK